MDSRTCKCIMEPTQNAVLVEKQAYKLMELYSSTYATGVPIKTPIRVLLIGLNLQKKSIASPHCARCGGRSETITLIMDLLIHYKICKKTKCISSSQFSWPKVWEAVLAIWTDSMRPIQQCLFSPMDTILGTLDHLDSPQL